MYFAVADIDLNPLIPFFIGLGVSVVSSPTGISGGFLILPISVNFLGFTSLAVSPTNFLFNILAMPSGLWRLHREKRLLWSLGGILMLGSLPGIFIGAALRATWLKEVRDFKIFVGLVLALLAANVARNLLGRQDSAAHEAEKNFQAQCGGDSSGGLTAKIQGGRLNFSFGERYFSASLAALTGLSLAVGLAGGIYGIGGAAIIAPLLISVFRLPIYVVSGAALLAGWSGAVFGLLAYAFFWPLVSGEPPVRPDWALGFLFGLGGLVGVYTGARLQRRLPAGPLKAVMFILIAFMALINLGLF